MGDRDSNPPLCAVIGHPVDHSVSPILFGELARQTRTALAYRRVDVTGDALASFLRGVRRVPLFAGLNVTLPHKGAVLRLADWVSDEARAIGAANVLAFAEGTIAAHNTDAMGVRATLRDHRVEIGGKTAVLFGAGGAARAVAYALGQLEAGRVVVVNRTLSRARRLVRDLSGSFPHTSFEAHRQARLDEPVALVVNATALGMRGLPRGEIALPPHRQRGAVAFDVVYRPARTSFLTRAQNAGFEPIGGLEMLVWQAIGAFELWFGRVASRRALKQALTRRLRREVLR